MSRKGQLKYSGKLPRRCLVCMDRVKRTRRQWWNEKVKEDVKGRR